LDFCFGLGALIVLAADPTRVLLVSVLETRLAPVPGDMDLIEEVHWEFLGGSSWSIVLLCLGFDRVFLNIANSFCFDPVLSDGLEFAWESVLISTEYINFDLLDDSSVIIFGIESWVSGLLGDISGFLSLFINNRELSDLLAILSELGIWYTYISQS
jgi:hypothetical protein